MLTNQWYAVATSREVGRRRPVGLRRFGRPVVVWRGPQGDARAAIDACPHRGAALSRGRVCKGELECPYHGLRFGPGGSCAAVPAHPALDLAGLELQMLPTQERRGLVWVWNGPADPAPLPWCDDFDAALTDGAGPFLDLTDTFDVSYLRIMENLTDVHHVPHVHRSTIPLPAEVTAFEARRDGHDVYVSAELGQRMRATIHLRAPFLGLLEFAGTARFAVVVCPIDEGHSWLFARYAQSVLPIPMLGRPLTWLLGQFDYRLLQRWQDLPVWRSQRLTDPADVARYRWLPADEGVRHYFDIHHELAHAPT